MNTGKKYKTRQKESILYCIRENADSYITIQELSEQLAEHGEKIGLTTIYRNLDKLEQEQAITKVSIEGRNGVCYRYLAEHKACILFYMKCEGCGNLVHIDCPELQKLYEHISEEHHMSLNPGKTMFYGRCEQCMEE